VKRNGGERYKRAILQYRVTHLLANAVKQIGHGLQKETVRYRPDRPDREGGDRPAISGMQESGAREKNAHEERSFEHFAQYNYNTI
jgi:hypothetical protein